MFQYQETTILGPDQLQLEQAMHVYYLTVKRRNSNGKRPRALQRSIIISTRSLSFLRGELEELLRELDGEVTYTLIPWSEAREIPPNQRVVDNVIVCITSSLELCRYNPEDGRFYSKEVKFCPYTGKKTKLCIGVPVKSPLAADSALTG